MAESPTPARSMRQAAETFLRSLPAAQQQQLVSDDPQEYLSWTYLPGTRHGLGLSELTPTQRELGLGIVNTAVSPHGFRCLEQIRGLDQAFAEWELLNDTVQFKRDYWLRFYGRPSADHPWAWRLSGHHVTIHASIVADEISVTPLFLGADPAEVALDSVGPISKYAGLRVLRAEEELARQLMSTLNPAQQAFTIVDTRPPRDIQTRRDPTAFLAGIPTGINASQLDNPQRETLRQLAIQFFRRGHPAVAESALTEFDADHANVSFAWAGSTTRGEGHYYTIRGSNLLIEYDNVENHANHIHTVWRHRRRDWGHDLLAEHYRRSDHDDTGHHLSKL